MARTPGIKELHQTLDVHDPVLWVTQSKDDNMKICSCGTIWWNNELRKDLNDEVIGKFWWFAGESTPPPAVLTEIAVRMGTKGTACACGLLPWSEMQDAKEHETHMFAHTMSDMITFNRPLPPKNSIPYFVGEKLLEFDELRLLLVMKEMQLFDN